MSATVDENALKIYFHKRFCSYWHRHLCRERKNFVPKLHSFFTKNTQKLILKFPSMFLFSQKSSLPTGDNEIRTRDPLLARQVLSQLSYTPIHALRHDNGLKWTRTTDLTLIRRAL